MKSPFPGMDPYLERHWLDVHTQLVADGTTALNQVLPDDLAARAEERLAIETEDDEDLRNVAPDVQVFEPGVSEPSQSGVALTAPFKLVVNLDPVSSDRAPRRASSRRLSLPDSPSSGVAENPDSPSTRRSTCDARSSTAHRRSVREARYGRTLDYTRPPSPPLEGEDAAWAHELLVRAGKRPEKAT